jgi:hypothetical protein
MKKQQIFLFVGPDVCAKSTLSKELSARTGIPYFKASSEHQNFLKTPERFILNTQYADTRMVDFLTQTKHSVISDRCFVCEWVYSSLFKRARDTETLMSIDKGFARLGAKIIFLKRKSYAGIVDNLNPKINEPVLKEIDFLYQEFLESHTRCEWQTIYVDDHDLSRQMKDIETFINGNVCENCGDTVEFETDFGFEVCEICAKFKKMEIEDKLKEMEEEEDVVLNREIDAKMISDEEE